MELVYRGAAHHFDPSIVEVPADEVETLAYRGQSYQCPLAKGIGIPQTPFDLVYRGVNYYTGYASGMEPTSSRHANLAELHRQNLQQRLQARIRSARSRGDQSLVQQLEAELQHMA